MADYEDVSDPNNPTRALIRHEFLASLIMLALKRYFAMPNPEEETPVAAVTHFIEGHLRPALHKYQTESRLLYQLPCDLDSWRLEHIYRPGVDFVLDRYSSTLHSLFICYAGGSQASFAFRVDPIYAALRCAWWAAWRSARIWLASGTGQSAHVGAALSAVGGVGDADRRLHHAVQALAHLHQLCRWPRAL